MRCSSESVSLRYVQVKVYHMKVLATVGYFLVPRNLPDGAGLPTGLLPDKEESNFSTAAAS
jgi:hypothetical protein